MEYIEREAASRAALIADCEDVSLNDVIKVTGEVAEAIKKIPTADVAPVRHGKWIPKNADGSWRVDTCSSCKRDTHYVRFAPPIRLLPELRGKNDGR